MGLFSVFYVRRMGCIGSHCVTPFLLMNLLFNRRGKYQPVVPYVAVLPENPKHFLPRFCHQLNIFNTVFGFILGEVGTATPIGIQVYQAYRYIYRYIPIYIDVYINPHDLSHLHKYLYQLFPVVSIPVYLAILFLQTASGKLLLSKAVTFYLSIRFIRISDYSSQQLALAANENEYHGNCSSFHQPETKRILQLAFWELLQH